MLSALLAHGHDIRTLDATTRSPGLDCSARAVGYEQRIAEEYSWDGLRRGSSPFLVIQHTVLGEGRLDHAGTRYRLRPGDCMLVTIPHAHRYWLQRGGRWEYFWMLLDGREAMRMARGILDTSGPVLRPGPEVTDRLAAACLTLLTGATTPGIAATQAFAAMAALHDAATGGRAAAPALPPAIARVTDHIHRNLGGALTVDRLAEIAGMSRAHFTRRFTAATGAAPSVHVMAQRLDRVERLLLATEMTVTEIAAATGFTDGNYLAKVFRRHRGQSPLDFRATRAERA